MPPRPARPHTARPRAGALPTAAFAALMTGGCASGSLDGTDAGLVDALTGGTGWRKPPVGSGDPAEEPFVGGEPQPQAPPSAKPPAGACGSIDAGGVCKGAVAFYCEAGALESQDCRAIGSACVFVAELGGFRCEPVDDDGDGLPDPPPDDDPLPPDDDPLPPDEEPLPPDDEPLPPDDEPLPPDEQPLPPDEAPPGGGCGGIDYLGECRGDVAVWCNGAALAEADCRALGTTCEWIDDEIGYYCRDPEPGNGDVVPDAFVPPPPEPGCDLGFLGECQGDVARYCAGDALIEVDCTAFGQICDYVNDVVGYYCAEAAAPVDECGGVDYTGYCDGDTVVWCDGGRLYSVDCAATGEICIWISEDGGYFCLGGP